MIVPISRRKREWTELDGTAVSRRSVAQVRVNSGDPGRCPKIRLKEPGPNGTSAGFQTDENRYYTLILAKRPRSDTSLWSKSLINIEFFSLLWEHLLSCSVLLIHLYISNTTRYYLYQFFNCNISFHF